MLKTLHIIMHRFYVYNYAYIFCTDQGFLGGLVLGILFVCFFFCLSPGISEAKTNVYFSYLEIQKGAMFPTTHTHSYSPQFTLFYRGLAFLI